MNRHYLRERDFEPGRDADAERLATLKVDAPPEPEEEPESSIHADPALRAVIILICVPIGIGLCVLCWSLLYLFFKFLCDLVMSLF